MSNLLKKFSWRVNLLRKGLLSFRYADWKGIFQEIFSSHSREVPYPEPHLIDQDGDFGLYQVAEKKIWFPLAFDSSFLGATYDEIFVQKVYESKNCQIHPGDWVIDAGACEGFFSLYALEKGANVLAFEPVPEIAQALERTLEPFIREGRARVFPMGLGREREEKQIFVTREIVTGSTFSDLKMAVWHHDANAAEKKPSQVIPLDLLVSEASLPPISFLKADVEGYERELLLGAKETIRKYKPRLSICTYHLPDDWQVIPRIIRSFGVRYRVKFRGGFFEYVYGW